MANSILVVGVVDNLASLGLFVEDCLLALGVEFLGVGESIAAKLVVAETVVLEGVFALSGLSIAKVCSAVDLVVARNSVVLAEISCC